MTEGYNASERKDVRRAEKESALWQSQRLEIIRGVMSLEPGRRWFFETLAACHVFSTPFTGENNRTNFNLGEQSVGLQILGEIERACPDSFILMLRENNERNTSGFSRPRANPNGGASEPDPEGSGDIDTDRTNDYDKGGYGTGGGQA